MSIFKVKLRTSDRLWTRYMRVKQAFTCQKCGRVYSEDNCRNLGVSHYFGRVNENVRFDEDNTNCMCNIPCHQYFDTHKTEYKDWMIQRLGQDGFDMLQLKKQIHKDRNDIGDAIIIRQMLKEVDAIT